MPFLTELIDLPAQPLISLIGAGGKTTTMYTLARELASQGKHVVTTTTTQIFTPTSDETGQLIVEAEPSRLLAMAKMSLQQHQHITIAGSQNERGKLLSVPPDVPALLLRQGVADAVLIEADGARHRMIKAPAEYEPVILPETNVALLTDERGSHQPAFERGDCASTRTHCRGSRHFDRRCTDPASDSASDDERAGSVEGYSRKCSDLPAHHSCHIGTAGGCAGTGKVGT